MCIFTYVFGLTGMACMTTDAKSSTPQASSVIPSKKWQATTKKARMRPIGRGQRPQASVGTGRNFRGKDQGNWSLKTEFSPGRQWLTQRESLLLLPGSTPSTAGALLPHSVGSVCGNTLTDMPRSELHLTFTHHLIMSTPPTTTTSN